MYHVTPDRAMGPVASAQRFLWAPFETQKGAAALTRQYHGVVHGAVVATAVALRECGRRSPNLNLSAAPVVADEADRHLAAGRELRRDLPPKKPAHRAEGCATRQPAQVSKADTASGEGRVESRWRPHSRRAWFQTPLHPPKVLKACSRLSLKTLGSQPAKEFRGRMPAGSTYPHVKVSIKPALVGCVGSSSS